MADDPNAGRDKQSSGTRTSLVTTNGQFGYGFGYKGNQVGNQSWFGPLSPMNPVAPDSTKGRILDYPTGYNLLNRPRPLEAVTFDQLRGFADNYDILRLIIETRKDQLGKLDWNISVRTKFQAKTATLQPMIEKIENFFIRPDGENFWDEWIRMLLEDLFVLDAPTLHRHKTVGGDLLALVPLDGATIKRVIDDYGRTPAAPDPAYQQILHGMPAVDYTTEELLYRPRNRRTHKIFGFSPVEQIVMTVSIAMRRQIWQLQAFTEGNIPEALIGTPATWTPDQVRQFQEYFDSMLSGNTGERRRARFVPGEVAKAYVPTKPDELFGAAEDWLARVCCFAFSVSPQPFIKMMNRATAATAQEVAVEEGLAPIQSWVKNLIDTVIIEDFGCPELEFLWADSDELDPNIRSQINDREVKNGLRTINEMRVEDGLDPYPDPGFDRPMQFTPTTGYAPIVLTPEEKAAKDAAAAAALTPPPGGGDGGSSPQDAAPPSQGGGAAPDTPPGKPGPTAGTPAKDDKGAAAKSDLPFDRAGLDSGNTLTKEQERAANGQFGTGDGSSSKDLYSPKAIDEAFHKEQAGYEARLNASGVKDEMKQQWIATQQGYNENARVLAQETAPKFEHGELDSHAKEALGRYTAVLVQGKHDYVKVNEQLRGDKIMNKDMTSLKEGLDKAVASSTAKEDMTLYRGVGKNSLPADLKVGDVIHDKGFSSTSPNSDISKDYSRAGRLMEISVKAGSTALFIPPLLNGSLLQNEVLLPRDSSYRVTGISGKTVQVELHRGK